MPDPHKSMWLEVSGADGRDYQTARQANKDWLAGVEFQDNTTGTKVRVQDIGPGLNVIIRYRKGTRVTNAEYRSDLNPDLSHSEAKAILENLSEQQARDWQTTGRGDEIEIDLTDYVDETKPETD